MGQRGEVEWQRFIIIIANGNFELIRDGHLLKQRKVQNNVGCATNSVAKRKICLRVCVWYVFSFFLFHLHTPPTHTIYWYGKKNVSENIHKKLITGLFHRKT